MSTLYHTYYQYILCSYFYIKKLGQRYPKLVRIKIYTHFISFGFNHGLIPWINNKLNVKRTFKKDTQKGIKILSDLQIEKYYTIVN